MRAALDVSMHNAQEQLSISGDSGFALAGSADDLCDELMNHIFACDACINDLEEHCATFRSLRERIAAAGGPSKSALLAI